MGSIDLFIDFDHTLFDTDFFFRIDFFKFMAKFGVSEDKIVASFSQNRTTGYLIYNCLETMIPDQNLFEKCMEDFYEEFSNLGKYLFADTIEFLTELSKNKTIRPILLTHGNPSWQWFKVVSSGINTYFDEVIFTEKVNSKGQAMIDSGQNKLRALLDNSAEELDSAKESSENHLTFMMMPRMPSELFFSKKILKPQIHTAMKRCAAVKPKFNHIKIFSLKEIFQFLG